MAHDDNRGGKTSSSGGRVSPITLQKHLKGTHYPASKEDLVYKARSNDAPDDIMRMIGQLPQVTYESPAEVMRAFGQAK
jgi:Protein of unknown function (DUF2795)